MVILNLKLNNILSFYDFNINFSYPIKLRTSTIDDENLKDFPSFRYKKLNVFIGSNASGKTSLIKCIWNILIFLNSKNKDAILDLVNKNYNDAQIEIDYVNKANEKTSLNRIKIKINKKDDYDIKVASISLPLTSNSSYENRLKELDEGDYEYLDYEQAINNIDPIRGWNVILPATETRFENINFIKARNDKEEKDYLDILNKVMKTLDPAIKKVTKSKDADNAYVIEHLETEKIIVQEGNKLSSIPLLSSGTKYGFNIANMIFAIKNHKNGIYLIDEQFSYVNSDIEAAILSTMVTLLGPDEQLFFTTHNASILNLGFPFHSFNFIKKQNIHNRQYITTYCASEAENRNNVSPKSILDNDVFNTAPDVTGILELGEK